MSSEICWRARGQDSVGILAHSGVPGRTGSAVSHTTRRSRRLIVACPLHVRPGAHRRAGSWASNRHGAMMIGRPAESRCADRVGPAAEIVEFLRPRRRAQVPRQHAVQRIAQAHLVDGFRLGRLANKPGVHAGGIGRLFGHRRLVEPDGVEATRGQKRDRFAVPFDA